MSDTIQPPAGFTLDQSATPQSDSGEIKPPPGFSLDQGSHSAGSTPHGSMPSMTVTAVRPPPDNMAPIVQSAAEKYQVPLQVANFVGSTESGWNPQAVGPETSSGRAQGAWQFMPGTAKTFGIDPTDFAQSTDAAMKYLRQLSDTNGGDWEKAVQQYGTFSTGQGSGADAAVRQRFRSYMGDNTPVMGDVAQGAGTGLMRGVSQVLGIPSDLWELIDRGSQYALTEGAAKLGILSEDDANALRQHMGYDEERPLGSAAINSYLTKLANAAGVNTDQPLTVPGQYASTIASFLPTAGVMGKAGEIPGALLKYGVLPGATSETAGQITKDTPLEPYARVAGAMAPMVPSAAMSALKQIANPAGKALDGATAAELTQAQNVLNQSRAMNAPLTIPEAVQQATGSGTRLGDLQRVVEQSPKGGAIMKPFYAQRPAQTEAMGRATFDQIAPPVSAPYDVAPQVQDAAQGAMGTVDAARSAAVRPFYTAAAGDTVPVADMDAFLGKIDRMIADDDTGILAPQLARLRDSLTESAATPGTPAQRIASTTPTGANIYKSIPAIPGTPRVPITDLENLDRARKFFRDQIDLPAWAQEAIPKEEGAKVGSLLNELNGMMEQASPNFVKGKARYQNITQNVVEPMMRSPIGQLSKAETFPKQAEVLFNSNPLPGSDRAVSSTVRTVAQSNPDAAKSLVRMYLEKTFNEATQSNMPGPNQAGGAKFAAVIAGNTQQAKNLEAAVRALPDGNTRWAALRKSLDIMEGMGKRQPVGSQTEFNRQINEGLKQGHIIGEIMATARTPLNWAKAAADMYHNFSYGRNTAELARIFTEGNVSDLQALARAPARTLRGQALLVGILAKNGANATPGTTQTPQSPNGQP